MVKREEDMWATLYIKWYPYVEKTGKEIGEEIADQVMAEIGPKLREAIRDELRKFATKEE